MKTQRDKALLLRDLHQGPEVLILPNIWDCASARVVEEAGFPVIATASASMSWALGYPDHQGAPRDEMLYLTRRIVASVQIPVTVDIEAGYGDTVAEVVETGRGVLAAGAVGVNLEDSDESGALMDMRLQVEKIAALRALGDSEGVPLVINARTDAFHPGTLAPDQQFAEAVRRLNAYQAAGADCLFAPFVMDAPTIAALIQSVNGPLNILLLPGMPSIPELEALGVRRVSTGPVLFLGAMTKARNMMEHLREDGAFSMAYADLISYPEMNGLMMR
ncbi:MAG: isocitrate lyase/phosphoenolpyruvate mutase family protein [Capsulimonas sp.]|uniref:isocitrate lyase/PEP mutase family protein n=1 Tax=Capsulimonas sp. TaxID=2494211 RepID=UPI003266ABA7